MKKRLPDQLIVKIVGFWNERYLGDEEKRVHFLKELEKKLTTYRIPKGGCISLYNDYDPQGDLLEVVRSAGIECSGYMFSGRDLFPDKTGITIYPDKVEAKDGYGGWHDKPFWTF